MMMYFVKCLLLIALIATVTGDSYNKRDELTFDDGASIELNGLWYAYRIQGQGSIKEGITCYIGNISKPGLETVIDMEITYSSGDTLNLKFMFGINEAPGVSLTMYNVTEDGSKGAKICDFKSVLVGNILQNTALTPCKISTDGVLQLACVSKIKDLTKDDRKTLHDLCPPNVSFAIKNKC